MISLKKTSSISFMREPAIINIYIPSYNIIFIVYISNWALIFRESRDQTLISISCIYRSISSNFSSISRDGNTLQGYLKWKDQAFIVKSKSDHIRYRDQVFMINDTTHITSDLWYFLEIYQIQESKITKYYEKKQIANYHSIVFIPLY